MPGAREINTAESFDPRGSVKAPTLAAEAMRSAALPADSQSSFVATVAPVAEVSVSSGSTSAPFTPKPVSAGPIPRMRNWRGLSPWTAMPTNRDVRPGADQRPSGEIADAIAGVVGVVNFNQSHARAIGGIRDLGSVAAGRERDNQRGVAAVGKRKGTDPSYDAGRRKDVVVVVVARDRATRAVQNGHPRIREQTGQTKGREPRADPAHEHAFARVATDDEAGDQRGVARSAPARSEILVSRAVPAGGSTGAGPKFKLESAKRKTPCVLVAATM